MDEDARRFGMDITKLRRTPARDGLWPWHEPAARLFLLGQSQIRWSGGMSPRAMGIDYAAMAAAVNIARLEPSDATFAEMQVIEGAAMPALNGRSS